jgi:RNA polymerase sigma-54 factor
MLAEYQEIPMYAFDAIKYGMKLLSRHAYNELGALLAITTYQAKEVASFITENLNPFPARSHWGDRQSVSEMSVSYQNPDIIISRLSDNEDSNLMVEIISPYSGYLRVNPLYKQIFSEAPQEKSEQWESDFENATLLVKCLQQRNHTIVRLMEKLVVWQRKFILYGDAHLLPLTRASVSEELEVHESTVSRAVASKAVQLPDRRIIPLAKFFDRSLHIRTALRDIVQQESIPLSDTQIVDLLLEQGYAVARRTVAKYRAMEGILPARLRRSNRSSNN